MPNDLTREECCAAAGYDRSGLALWEYLNLQYWGSDTLSEKYELDDKGRAITIDTHIGKDPFTPQCLMSHLRVEAAMFPREHRKSPDEIDAKFLLCIRQSSETFFNLAN